MDKETESMKIKWLFLSHTADKWQIEFSIWDLTLGSKVPIVCYPAFWSDFSLDVLNLNLWPFQLNLENFLLLLESRRHSCSKDVWRLWPRESRKVGSLWADCWVGLLSAILYNPLQGLPPSPKVLGPRVLFTWVIFSRLALGFRGASVSRVGCSSGATRSSL